MAKGFLALDTPRITRGAGAVATALVLLALPLAAAAQPAAKVPRVGYLIPGPAECTVTPRDEAFHQGLRALGHIPGQSITIDRRCFATPDQMRKALSDFVADPVDVIVASVPAVAVAARSATTTIPIVCLSCGDPLDYGLVASLARPGGNVTGLASLSAELIGKRLELVREAIPGVSRVVALLNPDNPGSGPTLRALDTAGRALGIKVQRVEFRAVADLGSAFRSAAAAGASVVLVQDDPHAFAGRQQIADLSLKHRLTAVAGLPDIAEAGALMAYGPSRVDLYRRAAGFVDKILRGTRPADLPFEQPTQFELVINLKTATALGLAIPEPLLRRADRIIR